MAGEAQLSTILATINAPRPTAIEAIHDLVLARVVNFEDLYRPARNWGTAEGRNVAWITEMAKLRRLQP